MTDPITRMQDAQRLLEDPLFNEAFKAIEDHYLSKLRGPATPNDLDALMAFRLVSKIKSQVVSWAQSGKLEQFEREQKERTNG